MYGDWYQWMWYFLVGAVAHTAHSHSHSESDAHHRHTYHYLGGDDAELRGAQQRTDEGLAVAGMERDCHGVTTTRFLSFLRCVVGQLRPSLPAPPCTPSCPMRHALCTCASLVPG